MIYRDEIDHKASEFSIHSSNVQRDYIFGWILSGIYSVSKLKDHFVLKGGNCLRKAYFENTRYSADLDFSVEKKLTDTFIKGELDKVCNYVHKKAGVKFENEQSIVRKVMAIDRDRTVHEARLYFKDFYGERSTLLIRIKLDITQFDKIYLPVATREIIHPYSDYSDCKTSIRCLKLEEVFASKLKCLLQRRQSNDLYDFLTYLLFNLKGTKINKAEIVTTFLKMTIFGDKPGIAKQLLLELPFQMLKSVWDEFVICPKPALVKPDDAIKKFREEISILFEKYPDIKSRGNFFPAKFRNSIFDAATSQTQLKLEYDGVVRYVEPYSLVFKRKKDGVSREYFYVYDTTGGSSPPGIKSLITDKLTAMENTTRKFEPRYDVELSKAIEASNNSYFHRPFSGGRRKA